jgi:hypothetical protein
MINKNKIVNLVYQLTTIIIELMFTYIFIINYKNENNYGNNYNNIVSLS